MATKKEFVSTAIAFGLVYRDATPEERKAYSQLIRAYCDAAQLHNPRFHRERFEEFVDEVSKGWRDAEGKVVKRAA